MHEKNRREAARENGVSKEEKKSPLIYLISKER